MWGSVDGTDWDQVPIDEDVFPRCEGPGDPSCIPGIDHLVALPDGGMFAVGGEFGDTYVAWTSTDGRDWRIVDEAFNPFATDEGPAQDGGLEVGDLIVALDGRLVTDKFSFSWLRSGHQPGDTVTLTVVRDGELDLEITLGTLEMTENFCKAVLATSTDGTEWTPVPGVLQAEGDSFFFSTVLWAGGVAATAEVCDAFGNCDVTLVSSLDGVAWQRTAGPDDVWSADLFPFIDGGLLASRTRVDDETGQSQHLFLASPDGNYWTLYAADFGISDAIVYNGRLVAVGGAPVGPLPGESQPRVWVYEPPT